jgi:hypothetical protein
MAIAVSVRRLAPVVHRPGPRYILVTQCLQKYFFRNPSCRLGLPKFIVRDMLLGKQHIERSRAGSDADGFSARALARGPLGQLLATTVGSRMRGLEPRGTLHVINIRDWHRPGPSYDEERRVYGCHCEAETWGAKYIDGLRHYLAPGSSGSDEKAQYFAAGSVRVYHIHSDTLFDFKPHSEWIGPQKVSGSRSKLCWTSSSRARTPSSWGCTTG